MEVVERAGELLLTGFEGHALSPTAADRMRSMGLASFVLYGRNMSHPAQLSTLTTQLQALAPPGRPFLIATDQEGGVVARITAVGGTEIPGNMALGATRSPQLAYHAAAAAATELLALGINWTLAPVLDVTANPRKAVLGVRSYGQSSELVSELGAAAIRGYGNAGLLCCGKHFPGLGDTDVDSHFGLPAVSHSRERLDTVELVPFRAAIGAQVPAIMLGHVLLGGLGGNTEGPASLSPSVITGLLREQLGFQGVIVTDDLEMGAIAGRYGVAQAAVRSLQAGADLVMVAHTPKAQEECLAAIRCALTTGELAAEQVAMSLHRLDTLRHRAATTPAPPLSSLGCQAHQQLAREIARHAVSVVRDHSQLLPLAPEGLAFVVCRPPAGEPPLAQAIRTLQPEASLLVVAHQPSAEEVTAAQALATHHRSVVVGTHTARGSAGQQALVRAVHHANPRTVLLAQRAPDDLLAFPEVGTCIAAYEDRIAVSHAAIQVLLGALPTLGQLPVSF